MRLPSGDIMEIIDIRLMFRKDHRILKYNRYWYELEFRSVT